MLASKIILALILFASSIAYSATPEEAAYLNQMAPLIQQAQSIEAQLNISINVFDNLSSAKCFDRFLPPRRSITDIRKMMISITPPPRYREYHTLALRGFKEYGFSVDNYLTICANTVADDKPVNFRNGVELAIQAAQTLQEAARIMPKG